MKETLFNDLVIWLTGTVTVKGMENIVMISIVIKE